MGAKRGRRRRAGASASRANLGGAAAECSCEGTFFMALFAGRGVCLNFTLFFGFCSLPFFSFFLFFSDEEHSWIGAVESKRSFFPLGLCRSLFNHALRPRATNDATSSKPPALRLPPASCPLSLRVFPLRPLRRLGAAGRAPCSPSTPRSRAWRGIDRRPILLARTATNPPQALLAPNLAKNLIFPLFFERHGPFRPPLPLSSPRNLAHAPTWLAPRCTMRQPPRARARACSTCGPPPRSPPWPSRSSSRRRRRWPRAAAAVCC